MPYLLRTVSIAALIAWQAAAPASGQSCAGDCNGDGRVVIGELVTGTGAALGVRPVAACAAMDGDGDGVVAVDELMRAIDGAQRGCRHFSTVAALPGWPTGARVNAVTPDGTVLLADDGERGFRWVDGRATELGVLPVSLWTYPVAASTDGVVVVGATNGGSAEGFRWQDGHLLQFGSAVYPNDISADGRIIAGYRYNGRGANVAFRWRDGMLADLGYLRPDSHTDAVALSADGSTVVGFGQYRVSGDTTVDEAFRWRDGVLHGLGFLSSGRGAYSHAEAVSGDGSVVVGTSYTAGGFRAYRWEGGVMTALGVLPGYAESIGSAVSGDGAVVFGRCQVYEPDLGNEVFTAFVWDRRHGMRALATVLAADFDLDLGGLELLHVTDVSLDGRTIVGGSVNRPAPSWIARLDRGW